VNTPTRRDFLKLFGLGAAGATLSAAGLYLPEPEPVRRYWQVGAQLKSGAGLRPGEIGLRDGTIVALGDVTPYARDMPPPGLRDFTESDRFEPLIIGGKYPTDTGLTFEKPLPHTFEGVDHWGGNLSIMLGTVALMKATPDIWDKLSAGIANKALADLMAAKP